MSQLTAQLRHALESRFTAVRVSGEIGNWSQAASGHVYFSLKDDAAVLSCVMWSRTRAGLRFSPAEGMKVECIGAITVYEKRGQYQLSVTSMEQAGLGDLYRRFLELKERLGREGLFDAALKRPLPPLPRAIGVVTSPGGAVIHDIRNVLARRAPWLPVYLWPARVQGGGAAREVASAIARLAATGLADVIIVARGGGSLEDLFEFNTEEVARAVRACPIPVVSAVGHETDVTICDFAADLRAPTPSAAAEIVSAGHAEISGRVASSLRRLDLAVPGRLRDARRQVTSLLRSYALRQPELLLRDAQQRLDAALEAMPAALARRIDLTRRRLLAAGGALAGHDPDLILARGYAVVRRARSGALVTDPATVRDGELLRARLAAGEIDVRAEKSNGQTNLFDS